MSLLCWIDSFEPDRSAGVCPHSKLTVIHCGTFDSGNVPLAK